MRSVRAGILLIVAEIDQIGVSLQNDWITTEHAANDLTDLETLPVYFAAHVLSPSEDA
jgi:hypothetical protein